MKLPIYTTYMEFSDTDQLGETREISELYLIGHREEHIVVAIRLTIIMMIRVLRDVYMIWSRFASMHHSIGRKQRAGLENT